MRYRLGSFRPRPGSSDYAHLLEHEQLGALITRALGEMLRLPLSLPTPGDDRAKHRPGRADLLRAMGEDDPDRAWVREVHLRMRTLGRRGLRLRLLACEYEPGAKGFLTIAASAPDVRLEVAPRDRMQIGFAAVRKGEGAVRAWPRLLREVCANGSLVCAAEFPGHWGADGIGDAVERFVSPECYGTAVHSLREAREIAVDDPRVWLDEFQRLRAPDRRLALLETIRQRFRHDSDLSLYGLMNAITAEARTLPDWRDRLDLEELAGRIAWLRRPAPSRCGGGVLVPA